MVLIYLWEYRVIFLVIVYTLPLTCRTCIKWLIICGILTVPGIGWSFCCVVCGLIALAGTSPWIIESWVCRCRCRCVLWLGSCTVLLDDVTYSLCTCVVCVCRVMWKLVIRSSCWVFTSSVFVVWCLWLLGWKSACCYVSCKWPCPIVRCLGMSIVGVRGLGSCRL